jgi:hypothetical protein
MKRTATHAENWIRENATNWMMVVDVMDMTGLERRAVYQAIAELDEVGVIETGKEGRFKKFRLKHWFQKMYGLIDSE